MECGFNSQFTDYWDCNNPGPLSTDNFRFTFEPNLNFATEEDFIKVTDKCLYENLCDKDDCGNCVYDSVNNPNHQNCFPNNPEQKSGCVECWDGSFECIQMNCPEPPLDVVPIRGCMNMRACNYDPRAEVDDGSCVMPRQCPNPFPVKNVTRCMNKS